VAIKFVVMHQQVFYIHGGSAFSQYGKFLHHLETTEIRYPHGDKPDMWPSSLRERLGDGYEVFTPRMPNSQNAKYEEWKIWFERHFDFLRDGVILVGWSQGGYFLAKYLCENKLPYQINALYLVAAPIEPEDFVGEDGGDFNFDIEKLPNLAKQSSKICIFHSKDDFVVPYKHALKYKDQLPEAELVTFEDKNHFLIEEFPELIEKIKAS